MKGPSLSGISATGGLIGTTVQILGDFFCPLPEGNRVTFAGAAIDVEIASSNTLTVRIPDIIYRNRSNAFTVTVAGQSDSTRQSLTVQDAWIRKATFHGTAMATAFSVSGRVYAVTGKECRRFDAEANVWEQRASFPGEIRYDGLAFTIGDRAWYGMGSNGWNYLGDLWEYNPASDSWRKAADFPYNIAPSVAMSANGKGYLAGGFVYINIFEYDPALDRWEELPGQLNAMLAGYPHFADAGFAIDNRLYVYLADDTAAPNPLYEYDPNAGSWVYRGTPEAYDQSIIRNTASFVLGNTGYITGKGALYKYHASSGSWEVGHKAPQGNYYYARSTAANNKAYLIGSYDDGSGFVFWEYDPAYD